MKKMALYTSTLLLFALVGCQTGTLPTDNSVPSQNVSSAPISISVFQPPEEVSSAIESTQVSSATENAQTSSEVQDGMLTLQQAKDIFTQRYPGIEIQTCKLETGDGERQQYYLFAMQDGYKYIMLIDAYSGEILLEKSIALY